MEQTPLVHLWEQGSNFLLKCIIYTDDLLAFPDVVGLQSFPRLSRVETREHACGILAGMCVDNTTARVVLPF